MFTRIVRLTVLALILLLSNHAKAEGAPPPGGESNVVLNHQLAAMVSPAPPRVVAQPAFEARSPRTAVNQQPAPSWFTSPVFLAIAEHFTSAERILHYRHGGLDANFWGVLNRRRSVRIEFSARL
jgi:hypothetical protein